MLDIPKPAIQSSLKVFSKPETLVIFDNSIEQNVLPVPPSNAPVVEFVLTTNRIICLDLQWVELKVDTKNAECANVNNSLETEVVDAATVPKTGDRNAFINDKLRSLSFNCDVLIDNEDFNTSNKLSEKRALFDA